MSLMPVSISNNSLDPRSPFSVLMTSITAPSMCRDCQNAVFSPPKFSSIFASHLTKEGSEAGLYYLMSAKEPPPQQECTLCALILRTLRRSNFKLDAGVDVPIRLYGSTLDADSDEASDRESRDLSMIYLDAGSNGRSAYSVQALEGILKAN